MTDNEQRSEHSIARQLRGKHDPARKERIVEAALAVIAEHGVHKTSHRGIAAQAGVPLGSLTYYFTGLEDILEHAFALLAERSISSLHSCLEVATTPEQALEAIADYVLLTELSEPGSSVLVTEMFSYANHNPAVLVTIQQWLNRVKRSLEIHFSPQASRAIDAFVEGVMIHRQMIGTDSGAERGFIVQTLAALADRFPQGHENPSPS